MPRMAASRRARSDLPREHRAMSNSTNLWQDSAPWRRVVVLTIVASLLSVLLLRSPRAPVVGASYAPPAASSPVARNAPGLAQASVPAPAPGAAPSPASAGPGSIGWNESHDPDF